MSNFKQLLESTPPGSTMNKLKIYDKEADVLELEELLSKIDSVSIVSITMSRLSRFPNGLNKFKDLNLDIAT